MARLTINAINVIELTSQPNLSGEANRHAASVMASLLTQFQTTAEVSRERGAKAAVVSEFNFTIDGS